MLLALPVRILILRARHLSEFRLGRAVRFERKNFCAVIEALPALLPAPLRSRAVRPVGGSGTDCLQDERLPPPATRQLRAFRLAASELQ